MRDIEEEDDEPEGERGPEVGGKGGSVNNNNGQLKSLSSEFHVLRPHCVTLLKEPTEKNLDQFKAGLALLTNPPPHLVDYVLFPFLVHFKQMHGFRDRVRTKLMRCAGDVFDKFEILSWEVFLELFQRLHLALGTREDPTILNIDVPEFHIEANINCLHSLCKRSLSFHFVQLLDPSRMQVMAHSIFLLLQVSVAPLPKTLRQDSLDIIHLYVSSCRKREDEAKRLFHFLPGIASSVRKVIDVRIGKVHQNVFMSGMKLLQESIMVTTEHQSEETLSQPDLYLSAVLLEVSKNLLTYDNVEFRKCLVKMAENLLPVAERKMPRCRDALLNALLVMKLDVEKSLSEKSTSILSSYSTHLTLKYDELIELLQQALAEKRGNNDDDCVTTLSKFSSFVTYIRFNFFEVQEVLEILFTLMTETYTCGLKSRSSVVDTSNFSIHEKNPILKVCSTICENLLRAAELHDIMEVCESKFTNFDGSILQSNFLGGILFINDYLQCVYDSKTKVKRNHVVTLSELEKLAQYYITVLDIQSSEIVMSVLENEAPKTQSLMDVRKVVLLRGLGLMGKLYPTHLVPTVLFHVIEHAGSTNSDIFVVKSAEEVLALLSSPSTLQDFLSANLQTLLNDLNVRILNLSSYPNSPNTLTFLAKYFDFTQTLLTNVLDNLLSRSCDPFSGGHLQYLYSKIFYAFLISIDNHHHKKVQEEEVAETATVCSFLSHREAKPQTFLDFISCHEKTLNRFSEQDAIPNEKDNHSQEDEAVKEKPFFHGGESEEAKLSPEMTLVDKICRRVLNFLPNPNRAVRLLAMDCLTKGLYILQHSENTLLPLAHTTWQNVVPRLMENDCVVVRKSFELVLCLCQTCGSFLRKQTLEEIFPVLSSLIVKLAKESAQVKMKDRKYYEYTQSYKLQIRILEGMAHICQSINIQEEDLHKVVDACLLYLKPCHHKNLQDAVRQLIDNLVSPNSPTKYKTVWMKLVKSGLRQLPTNQLHPSFTPISTDFAKS